MADLIYDGDEVLYVAARSAQEEYEFNGGVQRLLDLEKAKDIVESRISDALEATGCSSVTLAFSDRENNFRRGLAEYYKRNRTGEKPVGYYFLKEHLEAQYVTVEYPNVEADDVMGLLSDDFDWMASSDKDMNTIPSIHRFDPYAFARGHRNHIHTPQSEWDADLFWLKQTLIGDTSDGYKGCQGIGPKKADRHLDECEDFDTAWSIVVELFNIKQDTEEAILQARLARILRPAEYDSLSKQPVLWTPHS